MKNLLLISLLITTAIVARAEEHLRLATTTSTSDSGLLPAINPTFEKQAGVKVDVIAVGSGKALALGRNGDVDVLLTHDPLAEESFMADGVGVGRQAVMENDFVIVGPASDPAGVGQAVSAADAISRIAKAKAWFVSRGDKSGTHVKEQALFNAAAVSADAAWYLSAGQGMAPVLQIADQKPAYTLADRGTWLALRGKLGLKLLYAGDPILVNPYHLMRVNPARHPTTNAKLAEAYANFLTGAEGQGLISTFKVDGEVLFRPTAGK
jgi:tungstate transport system substrate-binding protein